LLAGLDIPHRHGEVVGIGKKRCFSFFQWNIVNDPIANALMVACRHLSQSSHISKLQQQVICNLSIPFNYGATFELTVFCHFVSNLVQQVLLSWVPILIMFDGRKPVFHQLVLRISLIDFVELRSKLAQLDLFNEEDTSSFISEFTEDAKAVVGVQEGCESRYAADMIFH
jgi:hypothetical protein